MRILIGLACLLTLAVALMGCGGSESKTSFKAKMQHFGGEDLVPNIEVRALNNTSGAELGITATTDAAGWVTFEGLPEGNVGFRSVADANQTFVDTYQFNIDSKAQDERLWIVDQTTYLGAPLMAGLTLTPGKAVVAGGVYWVNATDEEETVGCATVKADPESGDVRYFGDNGMPTTIDQRSNTNPLVSYYLIANLNPGASMVKGFLDAAEKGSTALVTFGDAISISNIYFEGAANPTPAACQ
jgi:hypothetical protein